MKSRCTIKRLFMLSVIICIGVGLLAGCGCKKRDTNADEDALMRDAMQVFATGEINTPKQLTAVLHDGSLAVEPTNDTAVLSFESPTQISKLDIVKRKAFGKDGKIPMPQIEEFEVYIQTDCDIDDTGWHWSEVWDSYDWDGYSEWGDVDYSYDDTPTQPYVAQLNMSGGGKISENGEYEVSCLDYYKPNCPSMLDAAVVSVNDASGKTLYHYDLANHTVLYRHRFVIKYTENGEHKVIMSDWSDPAWLSPKAQGSDA